MSGVLQTVLRRSFFGTSRLMPSFVKLGATDIKASLIMMSSNVNSGEVQVNAESYMSSSMSVESVCLARRANICPFVLETRCR